MRYTERPPADESNVPPAVVVWNSTAACNLKCEFCYNVDDPTTRELTTPEILDTLRKLSDLGIRKGTLKQRDKLG